MHLLYDHVNGILENNIKNILMQNFDDKENLRNTKNIDIEKIQSYYASDIFRSLFSVIELLCTDIKGSLLYEICKIVLDKLKEVHTDNDTLLLKLNESKDIICSCIFTLDSNQCLEIFPDFKKKIKSVLQKELYDRLKLYFNNIKGCFNNTIKIGCYKTIELMFIDIEKNFFCKIFTEEWNDEVVNGSFETFRTYFNRGFNKLLKQQFILIILVRSFVDSFTNYYIEEIIHSSRSLHRKTITDGPLLKYKLQYLKLSDESLKYSFKEVNQQDPNKNSDKQNVKKLDKFVENPNKKQEDPNKYKKYNFPVKKFSNNSKTLQPEVILKKIIEDTNNFSLFLDSFREDANEPFSKYFTHSLGENYIRTYLNKFDAIIGILSCHKDQLNDTITSTFKEFFYGEDGAVLLEALLHMREDYKIVTKPDMKKFYLRRYEN